MQSDTHRRVNLMLLNAVTDGTSSLTLNGPADPDAVARLRQMVKAPAAGDATGSFVLHAAGRDTNVEAKFHGSAVTLSFMPPASAPPP